jgi:hypothetical protein
MTGLIIAARISPGRTINAATAMSGTIAVIRPTARAATADGMVAETETTAPAETRVVRRLRTIAAMAAGRCATDAASGSPNGARSPAPSHAGSTTHVRGVAGSPGGSFFVLSTGMTVAAPSLRETILKYRLTF